LIEKDKEKEKEKEKNFVRIVLTGTFILYKVKHKFILEAEVRIVKVRVCKQNMSVKLINTLNLLNTQ
jgi:hypothetical protein